MAHFNSSGYWFNLRETFLLYCVFVLRFLWRAMFGVYVFGFYLANLCNWFLNSTLVFFFGTQEFSFLETYFCGIFIFIIFCIVILVGVSVMKAAPLFTVSSEGI
jgi:hypothetical protein